MSTLGAVLLEPECMGLVAQMLVPADFYVTVHRIIYEAMLALYDRNVALDVVVVKDELERHGRLADAGGPDVLLQLAEAVPSAANVEHYAKIVKGDANRRSAINQARRLVDRLQNGDELGETIDDTTRVLSKLTLPDPQRSQPLSDGYVSFPLDVLPQGFRRFVDGVSSSIGCDHAFAALPALATAAGTIGNAFAIRLKRGWDEPAIIWGLTIAPSGRKKSPPLEAVTLGPLAQIEDQWQRAHCDEMRQYESEHLIYERDLAQWKRREGNTTPPEPPERPVPRRIVVQDITRETLAPRLAENPRGLVLARDELSGWIGSFDAYKQAKGSDVAAWLEAHRGGSWRVDRKNGAIRIPRVALSICGTIQPDALRRSLGVQYVENGLAARLLLAMPPARVTKWTEDEISEDLVKSWAGLLSRLLGSPLSLDECGSPRPTPLTLDSEAKQLWVDFYNRHGEELASMNGPLASVWAKLEGAAARLALVVHLVNWAEHGASGSPGRISGTAMRAGIELADWFGHEAQRAYGVLEETRAGRKRRETVELLRRLGTAITPRELARRSRMFVNVAEAEAALQALVRQGCGTWIEAPSGPKGGRPTRRFVLSDGSGVDVTETDETAATSTNGDSRERYGDIQGVSSTGFVDTAGSGDGRTKQPPAFEGCPVDAWAAGGGRAGDDGAEPDPDEPEAF